MNAAIYKFWASFSCLGLIDFVFTTEVLANVIEKLESARKKNKEKSERKNILDKQTKIIMPYCTQERHDHFMELKRSLMSGSLHAYGSE